MFLQTPCVYFCCLPVYTQMPGIVLKLAASINKWMRYYLLIVLMPLTHHGSFHQKTGFVGRNLYKHPTPKKTPQPKPRGVCKSGEEAGRGETQTRRRRLAAGWEAVGASP